MTDQLPYTYTDDEDVAVRVGPRVCTVYDRPGRTSVGFYTPAGEDAVRLARAVLAAAGDTGHRVVSVEDMSEGRVAAMRIAAEATFERAVEAMFALHGPGDESAQHYAEAIRALPLLPDGDTTEDAITDAQDAQLPDRNGGVVNDIRIALDTRVDLTPEHRAFYAEIIHRFEGLAADRDQVRVTRDRYRDERNTARAEKAQVLQAAREATGRLPEEDLAEHGDEVSDRVGALEQQYTDLANLVHGHGEDLARLRCRFTEEDDG